MGGLHAGMWVGLGVALVGAALALLIRREEHAPTAAAAHGFAAA